MGMKAPSHIDHLRVAHGDADGSCRCLIEAHRLDATSKESTGGLTESSESEFLLFNAVQKGLCVLCRDKWLWIPSVLFSNTSSSAAPGCSASHR
jgi:hypothetical protein